MWSCWNLYWLCSRGVCKTIMSIQLGQKFRLSCGCVRVLRTFEMIGWNYILDKEAQVHPETGCRFRYRPSWNPFEVFSNIRKSRTSSSSVICRFLKLPHFSCTIPTICFRNAIKKFSFNGFILTQSQVDIKPRSGSVLNQT